MLSDESIKALSDRTPWSLKEVKRLAVFLDEEDFSRFEFAAAVTMHSQEMGVGLIECAKQLIEKTQTP